MQSFLSPNENQTNTCIAMQDLLVPVLHRWLDYSNVHSADKNNLLGGWMSSLTGAVSNNHPILYFCARAPASSQNFIIALYHICVWQSMYKHDMEFWTLKFALMLVSNLKRFHGFLKLILVSNRMYLAMLQN